MIPTITQTIRMDMLTEAMKSIPVLDRDTAIAGSLFDVENQDLLQQVRVAFLDAVLALENNQGDLRRTLGWMLNQPDYVFEAAVVRSGIPLQAMTTASLRHLLEWLWSEAFADWQIADFAPDAYQIVMED